MKRIVNQVLVLIVLVSVWSCGPKKEPQPALPGYLRVPAVLEGYTGSGRFSTSGGVTLLAEGPEQLDPKTSTYSGVLGNIISNDVIVQFTVGQPQPYAKTSLVPAIYQASGTLAIKGSFATGTYSLDPKTPSPRGEYAYFVFDLPGGQIYLNTGGSLTITESTLIKTQDSYSLYRIVGSFEATAFATGAGITNQNPSLSGTFDVLVVK